MSVKLEGVIYEELYKLFMIKDDFTVGQKFTQIEKTAKKRFYDLTDEELYDTLKKLVKTDYHSDTF